MDTVNEKSTYVVSVCLKDTAGQVVVPTSVVYRIDDVSTGNPVKADTTITPVTHIFDITVAATENAIVTTAKSLEKKRMTVTATYNTTEKATAEFEWYVRNLTKIT
jgi:hypothetical protein